MTKDQARKKWLETLRNPETKKAYKQLAKSKNSVHRCCLGHACHALGHSLQNIYNNEGLPQSVSKLLDITWDGEFANPIIIGHRELYSLVDLNDLTKKNMSQIADIVEREMENGNLKPYE